MRISAGAINRFLKKITVLLADDNGIVRKEFRRILEFEKDLEVVGEAKNGREAVTQVKKLRPSLVLMDVAMPLLTGLEATREILMAFPATKVIMVSAHDDEEYVQGATDAGAVGYVIKQTCAECLGAAIHEVENGNTFYSGSIPSRLHKGSQKKQKRVTRITF